MFILLHILKNTWFVFPHAGLVTICAIPWQTTIFIVSWLQRISHCMIKTGTGVIQCTSGTGVLQCKFGMFARAIVYYYVTDNNV